LEIFQVCHEKCIQCGACANVCPRRVIEMDQGWPKCTEPEFCMACGQCVAVCPRGALDHKYAPSQGQIPIDQFPPIDEPTAWRFLRSRRSIRSFKQTPVPKSEMLRLLDVARFAPTASNSQGLSYKIFDDTAILQKMTAAIIDWMEELVNQGSNDDWAKAYSHYVSAYRKKNKDVILRDAPCLVLATAPQSHSRGRDNTHFSLAYVELYAPVLGLGTCYMGLLEACALAEYKPLLELLNLSDGKVVTGAVIVGYPVYQFPRLVDRRPLDISFV